MGGNNYTGALSKSGLQKSALDLIHLLTQQELMAFVKTQGVRDPGEVSGHLEWFAATTMKECRMPRSPPTAASTCLDVLPSFGELLSVAAQIVLMNNFSL